MRHLMKSVLTGVAAILVATGAGAAKPASPVKATPSVTATPLATPTAPTGPSAAAWKPYRYQDLGFTVDFPGEPKRQDLGGAQPASGIRPATNTAAITVLVSVLEQRPYVVMRVDASTVGGPVPADPDKTLEDTIVGRFAKGDVLSDAAFPTSVGVGRELVVKQGDGLARLRLYSHWPKLYALILVGPTGKPDALRDADAERFVKSFALISKVASKVSAKAPAKPSGARPGKTSTHRAKRQ